MPEQKTVRKAKEDKKKGKSPSTQAGEFVKEEIEHVRKGKHGARSAKQVIAIGLSKARRAGVNVPAQKGAAKTGPTKTKTSVSKTRSAATKNALKKEGKAAASTTALSRQAKAAAKKRTATQRSTSAKKAAKTRKRTKG